MKHILAFAFAACALLPLHAQDEATANGVVSIDDNRALTVRSNNGSFEFKTLSYGANSRRLQLV